MTFSDFYRAFKDLDDRVKAKKGERNQALRALIDAHQSTKKHIIRTRVGESTDIESEELRVKWLDVATVFRDLLPEQFEIFLAKSEYWMSPELFKKELNDGERRFDFRYRLDEVGKLINVLNKNWK